MKRFAVSISLALVLAAVASLDTRAFAQIRCCPDRGISGQSLSSLASRLLGEPAAARRGPDGRIDELFGVSVEYAARVFAPVSPWRPVPPEAEPRDLIWLAGIPGTTGQPVSAVAYSDLEAMVGSARIDEVVLVVLSAYRSAGEQAVIFERNVQRQFARADGPLSREEAEDLAGRVSARPGHSQHQLGTAIDFTSPEIGNSLNPRFAETAAGSWLGEHSWSFGFVIPYTAASDPRSGYRAEPWHFRWIGRPLAEILQRDGYAGSSAPIVDDYLSAVLEILRLSNAHGTSD